MLTRNFLESFISWESDRVYLVRESNESRYNIGYPFTIFQISTWLSDQIQFIVIKTVVNITKTFLMIASPLTETTAPSSVMTR